MALRPLFKATVFVAFMYSVLTPLSAFLNCFPTAWHRDYLLMSLAQIVFHSLVRAPQFSFGKLPCPILMLL